MNILINFPDDMIPQQQEIIDIPLDFVSGGKLCSVGGCDFKIVTRHSVEFKEEGYEDRAEIHPICPNCKEYLDNEKWGFCPYCGIPIEWK